MARLELRDVSKRYGRVLAVDSMSLDVRDGEFLALLGPSGCGKSSTMRMIAGLESITSGAILIDGRRVNDAPPAERQTAMSFENYGLYPHMTVFQNIAYPLRIRHRPEDEVHRAVIQIARLLQIEDQLHARPQEVGVGVQQRVSLARALVRRPSVFLLDEPLSHLDADLRSQMRGELKRLQKLGSGATMVYVTHDQLEAMTMADRIAVMNEGRLQQVGTPDEVFRRPANRFVASFIGEPAMNLLSGTVERAHGGARLLVDGVPMMRVEGALAQELLSGAEAQAGVQVGVRPSDAQLAPPGEPGLPVRVRVREFLGEQVAVIVEGRAARLRVLGQRSAIPFTDGEGAVFRPRPERVHFFSARTGEAIGRTEH